MKFLLELKDDLVLISTWENDAWYCWGSVYFDAFWVAGKLQDWKQELSENGKVVVSAEFNIISMLPPDNPQ